MEAFEKSFGTTDVTLPEHLKMPSFIAKGKAKKDIEAQVTSMHPKDNYAVAARNGADQLPNDIQKKMYEDRRKADGKVKKNNTKRK